MDEEPQLDSEFVHNSTTGSHGSTSYGTGMFSGSQHFTVTGENLTNITNNYPPAPTLPSDFRMIPLGDIDLQYDTGVIGRHREWGRPRVRRVYSAKVEGRTSSVTVAMYQGHGAEEEWQRDIARYMTVRHPNIIQVCGAASSGNIHATLFNDDMIPLEHFVDLYRNSHFSQVYIYACCHTDFQSVRDYFYSAFEQDLYESGCTFWIRRSTGRLCTDLIPPDYYTPLRTNIPGPQGRFPLSASNTEAAIIESLTVERYHEICICNLRQTRFLDSSSATVVNMGTVLSCPLSSGLEDSVEIASVPNAGFTFDPWILYSTTSGRLGVLGELTEDGWTRFNSGDVSNIISLGMRHTRFVGKTWLSQANHIFSRLGITSNFEDYFFVHGAFFEVSASAEDPPPGYLFLCPTDDFRTGPSSFCWPDDPAYWSLDPLGAERLTMNAATALGFPSIQFSTVIGGSFWDSSVYAGIRRFHQAKGFDPESQDVARHLGEPLYQLSSEVDSPFAYVDDENYSEEEELNLDDSEDVRSSVSEDDDESKAEDGSVPGPLALVDDEYFSAEEDNQDPFVDLAGEAGYIQTSDSEDFASQSTAGDEEAQIYVCLDEIPLSQTFKFTMHLQLALIIFLALSWVYDQVRDEKYIHDSDAYVQVSSR